MWVYTQTEVLQRTFKHFSFTGVKCIVSIVLIFWALRNCSFKEIFLALRSTKASLLFLAIIFNVTATYLRAYRWGILLKAQGVDVTLSFLFQASFVGMFFSNLLPSTIGGDVSRIYDSWRVGKSKADAVSVVIIDRFLGVVALMLFVLGMLPFSLSLIVELPYFDLCILLAGCATICLASLIFLPAYHLNTFLTPLRIILPGKTMEIFDVFLGPFQAFRSRRASLSMGLLLSLILQTVIVIYYYLVGKTLNFPLTLDTFFLIIPISILIMMIPISINAIGVREGVFIFFFSIFGLSNSQALAFAWLVYGVAILNGLVGGIIYMLRKRVCFH